MSQDKNTQNKKTKMTSKQIFAIIGIILLVLLYVVTLFAAIFDSSASHALFATCLLATVGGAFICRDAFCGDLRQLRQPRAIRHLPASHRGHPSSHLDLHLDVWKTDKPLHLRRLPSGRKGERK